MNRAGAPSVSSDSEEQALRRTAVGYAIGVYIVWGFFPVYWKLLNAFPAAEILAHRIVWSFVFYWLVVIYRERKPFAWLNLFRDRTSRSRVMMAGLLLSGNWLLYIWAVNSGHVVESSLGYFMTPLLNVLMGRVILGEPLARTQWIAVGFASVGVLIMTLQGQGVPWVSLGLAISFSTYGLIRKSLKSDVFQASTSETIVVLPFALIAVAYFRFLPADTAAPLNGFAGLLLLGSGIITGLPLLLFVQAARRLPLSMMGFFQYISPSIQFLLGVFAFGETLTSIRLIAFGWIWAALALYTFNVLQTQARRHRSRRTSDTDSVS